MLGDENVKIDIAHANLLKALVMANKPTSILEIGLGGGRSADAILEGLKYNELPYNYTLVDNWWDWGGNKPEIVDKMYGDKIDIITSDEKDFVFSCKESFDFIMSDGDHLATDQWFTYVYDNLLQKGGILIYHDVNFHEEAFTNLRNIYFIAKKNNIRFKLFDKSSLDSERCHRGLMVIFKD